MTAGSAGFLVTQSDYGPGTVERCQPLGRPACCCERATSHSSAEHPEPVLVDQGAVYGQPMPTESAFPDEAQLLEDSHRSPVCSLAASERLLQRGCRAGAVEDSAADLDGNTLAPGRGPDQARELAHVGGIAAAEVDRADQRCLVLDRKVEGGRLFPEVVSEEGRGVWEGRSW